MIKYRWLKVSLGRDTFSRISSGMIKSDFTSSSSSGFRLERVNKDNLQGRYIRKNLVKDQYEDPFGNVVVNDIVTYDIYDFKLTLHFPNLVIKNPPRNIKPFLLALSEASNFKITIQPLILNLNDWIESIEGLFGEVILIKLQGSGLMLSEKASAQVLICGTEDVRAYWGSMFSAPMPSIDRAKIRVNIDGFLTDCELTKQGSVSITNARNNQDKILSLLTQSLAVAEKYQ